MEKISKFIGLTGVAILLSPVIAVGITLIYAVFVGLFTYYFGG